MKIKNEMGSGGDVRRWLKEQKKPYTWLALVCGVHPTTVVRWLSKRRLPRRVHILIEAVRRTQLKGGEKDDKND